MPIARLIPFMLVSYLLVTTISHAETTIRIGGSGTGSGAMKVLAKAFERKNPGILIKVMPSLGSSGGIKALMGGALDIAMSARPLNEQEKIQGATVVFSSRTPFILMVNKNVSQINLTTSELEAILAGRQLKWPDGKTIQLILRPEGDTDTRLIQAINPKISQAMKTALASPEKHVALTDQDADKDIVNTPGSLGFSTTAQHITETLSAKVLTFNGVAPSLKMLKKRSYPLAKELLVVLNQSKVTPDLQKFITFLKTPAAVNLLENCGVAVAGP